jgi:SAM-dependent methyltransferase
MLDIGGGSGIFSFYAACRGAKRVICLEPDLDGSGSTPADGFRRLQSSLPEIRQVDKQPLKIQDFQPGDERFDLILMNNSVNHLNEEACINLQQDPQAKKTYMMILQELSDLSARRAKLIIADCSRYNFFPLCHMKNPFARTIEWHKHQSPEFWADLLTVSGFTNPEIQWRSFDQLRSMGRFLLGNKIMAYFLRSHFCLTMEKVEDI